MSDLTLSSLNFRQLSNEQLYALLQLRSAVFVVEQDCVFQDMDDRDQEALHVLGTAGATLVCYARLLPPGSKYAAASIGRVVTAPEVRRYGYGRELMSHCIGLCREHWPDADIVISAQQYLQKFYEGFGFRRVSGPYLEDGIPHLEMQLAFLPSIAGGQE